MRVTYEHDLLTMTITIHSNKKSGFIYHFYSKNHLLAPKAKAKVLSELKKRALAFFMVPRKFTFAMPLFFFSVLLLTHFQPKFHYYTP